MKNLVLKNRSYRRFHENIPVSKNTLKDWIDIARMAPSPKNNQALKYIITNENRRNNLVFQTLSWAGYLTQWKGPCEGERPTAYIIIVSDNEISPNPETDYIQAAWGICAQTILLAATNDGFGGCIIASIKKDQLRETLNIPLRYNIVAVIALGKPNEIIKIEDTQSNDIRYWRDEQDVHHVPKRTLNEIILNL